VGISTSKRQFVVNEAYPNAVKNVLLQNRRGLSGARSAAEGGRRRSDEIQRD
jgi:hypothetical protein